MSIPAMIQGAYDKQFRPLWKLVGRLLVLLQGLAQVLDRYRRPSCQRRPTNPRPPETITSRLMVLVAPLP